MSKRARGEALRDTIQSKRFESQSTGALSRLSSRRVRKTTKHHNALKEGVESEKAKRGERMGDGAPTPRGRMQFFCGEDALEQALPRAFRPPLRLSFFSSTCDRRYSRGGARCVVHPLPSSFFLSHSHRKHALFASATFFASLSCGDLAGCRI